MKNLNMLTNNTTSSQILFVFFFILFFSHSSQITNIKSSQIVSLLRKEVLKSKSDSKDNEITIFADKLFNNNNLTDILNRNLTNIIIKIDKNLNKEVKLFCKNHCSFRGYCLEGNCYCKPGYGGDDCSILLSKEKCLNNCSEKGVCNDERKCICNEGYAGIDCSISKG